MRALCLLLLAACGDEGTSARLTVQYQSDWQLDQFEVGAHGQQRSTAASSTVRVLLRDDWVGQPMPVELWGIRGKTHWAHGSTIVTPVRGKEVTGEVVMTRVPCGAWCTLGATSCNGDGVATCAPNNSDDSDQCFVWASPSPCPAAAAFCSNGACAATCVDECASGERRCAGPGAVETCGQGDSDSCNDWLQPSPCPQGQVCSNGACAATCKDECMAGASQCSGGGAITCADLDGDGCLEWGPIVPCASSCSGGICTSKCTDECTAGQGQCDGMLFRSCGQFDSDSCLDLSPGISCVPSDACTAGMCTPTGCATAPNVCMAPPQNSCVDSSTLRTYSASGTCSPMGTCDYAHQDVTCVGCPNCDPCGGVTCNSPPAPTCVTVTVLRTYTASGTCSNGTCSYTYSDQICGGCTNGTCCQANCSGKVCGDDNGCGGLCTKGCWSDDAPMPIQRFAFAAATGLDGRIYVMGGSNGQGVTEVDEYTPGLSGRQGTWRTVSPMPRARFDFNATTGLDGRIYAVGGEDTDAGTTMDIYTPGPPGTPGTWTAAKGLPEFHFLAAVTTGGDGRIYVAGGGIKGMFIAQETAAVYSPASDSWASLAPLSPARFGQCATRGPDGRLYSIGGTHGYPADDVIGSVDAFTISSGGWAGAPSLTTPRYRVGCATSITDGRIYAVGGESTSINNTALSALTAVEAYTPGASAWVKAPDLNNPRADLAVVAGIDGRIYALGGGNSTDNELTSVENYTP